MITTVTPTIPERADMLEELKASLAAQTVAPTESLVRVDHLHAGPVATVNMLVEDVETEWFFRCDDDDLFHPNHFEIITSELGDDWDIVYSWPHIDPPGHLTPDALQRVLPLKTLRDANWIASAAAIRTSLWRELGGYRDVHNEDHDFWIRALDAGARFKCIPKVTWTYRLGDWPHRCQETP